MNHSNDPMDLLNQLFGGTSPQTSGKGSGSGGDATVYGCNQCKNRLQHVTLDDFYTGLPRKLFYCTNKQCSHYGLLTVVAVRLG